MTRLALLFVLLAPGYAAASFDFSPGCREAYHSMVRLQFSDAAGLLAREKKADPGNYIPHYVESYIDFLTAFISEEEADYAALRSNRTERLNLLDREDMASPYYRLVKAELYLQTAIVRVKRREYITAAYEFRKAYKLLEDNTKRHPSFLPNRKCLGILHALIGYMPSNYKWLTRLLGFRGTIPQGLGELHALLDASQRSEDISYLYDETAIVLMFLEFHLNKNNKAAMELADRIEKQHPGPLHLFSVLSIYLYSAKNDRSIALLTGRKKDPAAYPFYYLDFMTGIALLNKLDVHAGSYFQTYVDHYRGDSFIKSAYQKLAWIELIRGNTAGYAALQDSVKARGDDFTDEDKHALTEAEKAAVPNVYLLRARLLFDGGYYRESLAELAGKEISLFPKFNDQLEFTYRLARIYDQLGLRDMAVKHYKQTVKNGESYSFYFAANAALYMGRLFENEGNREEAVAWYRKCLSMRHHEYQNSIDQRAEAGLNRLGAQ